MPFAFYRRRCARAAFVLLGVLVFANSASAQISLHKRIDALIAAGKADFPKLAAEPASDAEFLRRIYLDLAGMIPAATEARAFLDDPSPNKRQELLERLLASPEYARHLTKVFDVLLMDRRPDKHIKRPEWQEYLRSSFGSNKPYDQLVREILSADGADPKQRGAAKFYLDRDGEPHVLTKDISRLFLGMNLTCCQCHHHPLVDAYKQDDYYGIFAFLNRSFVFADKAKNFSVFAEKAEGETTFQSVFMAKVTKNTGPRLPDGPPLVEPKFDKGKEYDVAAAKDVRPIPKFSRRAQLAKLLTSPDNKRFARASANRLWALMLGRGIVHPVEYDHDENPPSHPELLDALAEEFTNSKCDVKAFVRQITLSKTYQRSSVLPKGVKEVPDSTFAVSILRPLSPEQMAWSMMQATGLVEVERKAVGPKAGDSALYAKLAGNEAPFVTLFGGQPGEPSDLSFQATLDQTLFLSNGGLVRGWLALRPGNLTDRLSKLKDAAIIAEELYLSVLTRLPTPQERQEVADFLARHPDRAGAVAELAWALLASAEFRFNH